MEDNPYKSPASVDGERAPAEQPSKPRFDFVAALVWSLLGFVFGMAIPIGPRHLEIGGYIVAAIFFGLRLLIRIPAKRA